MKDVLGATLPKWGIAPYTLPAWYPTAGIRRNTAASSEFVGDYAYYWSVSLNNTDGFILHMGSTWAWPARTLARSFGFSVRCLHI